MLATRTRVALIVAALAAPALAEEPDVYTRTVHATALIIPPTGGGTGWVVDLEQGLIVTNEHVVTRNGEVEVIFPEYGKDGRPLAEPADYRHVRRLRADVIDADGPRDLALLRLRDRPPAGVTALQVADREPRPADRVHSIGNPDASGALWVYSTGTVRQVYRKEWRYADALARAARVLEMQSAINPGDSGGPVVNDAGELVGVVSGKKAEAALMSWCIAAAEVKDYLAEARPLVEPKTAAAFYRRGVRSLGRGLAVRAADDLSAAYRLAPKSADILAARALAYRARKDYDLAATTSPRRSKLNPQHAGALNARGCVHTDSGANKRGPRRLPPGHPARPAGRQSSTPTGPGPREQGRVRAGRPLPRRSPAAGPRRRRLALPPRPRPGATGRGRQGGGGLPPGDPHRPDVPRAADSAPRPGRQGGEQDRADAAGPHALRGGRPGRPPELAARARAY